MGTINWLAPLHMWDERLVFPVLRNNLTDLLAPYLDKDDTILDVGSSCGRLSSQLVKRVGCKIEGIDVLLQPHTYIPVQQYDGRHFPFHENSFDGVMMVDMLHHTTHPEQVLREAMRVSRRYLLVKDHFWETHADKAVLGFADYVGNAPYGIDLPYNYLSIAEWMQMFNQLGLRIVDFAQFRYAPLDPCKQLIFKLEK